MTGFLELTWMETKLFIREWQAVFFTFIFLPMLMFLFGLIYNNEPDAITGFGSVDVMLPGYVSIGIAANALFTIGGVLAAYREKGILRRFRVTPLSPVGVLAAQVIVAYVMALFSAIVMMTLAKFAFGLRVEGDLLVMLMAFTIGAVCFFSFGFLLAGLFRTARVSYSIMTSIFFPLIFLSGAAIPMELMPPVMHTISKFIPLTYVVDLMKDAWLGRTIDLLNIVVLLVILAVCATLSMRTFKWD
jgi:ABC-2 type transport system permease protein